MEARSKQARFAGITGAALLLAGATLFLPGSPASGAAVGPYSAHAQASALHVDALTLTEQDVRVANLNVGVAGAAVDSTDLKAAENDFGNQLIPSEVVGKKSFGEALLAQATLADAPNADPTLDGPLGDSLLLARAAAPGSDPAQAAVLDELSQEPVVHAEVLNAQAVPAWNASTCIVGAPIAGGEFAAAKLEVVETAADEDTHSFDAALASVDADADGPERDAVDTRAYNILYDGAGDGFGLMSTAFAELVPVTLFEGTPAELTVDVGGPARLRAMADGTAGGAKVEFDAPAVSFVQGGERTVVLPNASIPQLIELPVQGVLEVRVGLIDREATAGNGQSASAAGSIVTIKVLESAVPGLRGATVSLGHMEVAAAVPAGGVICPIDVDVVADPTTQVTGRTIDVTTTVHNRFECPLTDVTLVDRLSTEANALFTITDAPGAKSKTSGTRLSSGQVSWDIGTIPARGKASRTFTLRVDDGAGKINVTGDADGTLTNCLVNPGNGGASVVGLGKGSADVEAIPVTVKVPVTKVLGGGVQPGGELPATGVGSMAFAGLSLLSGAGVLARSLRRR